MPAVSDPSLLLLFGFDESLPTATRANVGALGSAQDLSPVQSTGTDGIPAISDGNGGRALDVFLTRTGYTSASRALRGAQATGAAHAARCSLPTSTAGTDFAFGCRFQFGAGNTGGGGIETEQVWGLSSIATCLSHWGIGLLPNDASAATAAKIRLHLGGTVETVDATGYTTTGSPPTFYILPNEWYRVVVRAYWSGTGVRAKVYVVRESTGTIYTLDRSSDFSAFSQLATLEAATDVAVHASFLPVSGFHALYAGLIDEAWLYDAPLSDTEATSLVTGGFSIPWTAPSYRVAEHAVHVAVTNEGQDFPRTRPLAVGALAARFPPDRHVRRARVRVESWRPGRPWLLRCVEGIFDTQGPFSSKAGNRFRLDDPNMGLHRNGGELPAGAWEDVRNVETTVRGPRSRRGFRIRRNVATDQGDNNANAFAFFRNNADTLYGVFKVGSKLYEETGAGAAALDTGWNSQQLPVFLFLDNRLVILSGSRRRTWRGQTGVISSLGISAPGSIGAAAASGGTLNGSFYYAATFYDPTTGDESAPVVSAVVSPSTQKVTLTLPSSSGDTRFTQYRIYRTTNGGSPPNLFLIKTVTIAASVDDTGEVDGTQLVGQVTDSSGTFLAYITGALPDSFSFGCVHMERIFYSGGATYPERIYATEANEVQRFYPSHYLVCEAPVRALASWGHRLVAFTDSTVEIFESDWVRDADGNRNVQRTVLSRTVGAVGPAAVRVIEGSLFWLDRRAFWTMRGTEPVPLSGPIRDLFPYINHGISRRAVVSFNHLRRQVWCSIAHATLQPDSSRFQTILVADLDALQAGVEKWTVYEQEATFHGAFDDDLNGLQFGMIDGLGVFKQAETYEGDGAQGNEAFTTEDAGGESGNVGIASISGSVITVHGSPGWSAGALRGMSVVLRDRSTGRLYWHLLSNNGTGTLTVVGTPDAALAQRDGWAVGGIVSYVQFAEQALATPNEKVIRQVHLEFAALTRQDLYL